MTDHIDTGAWLYAKAEAARIEARLHNQNAEVALKEPGMSPLIRDQMANVHRAKAALAYDNADDLERAARNAVWEQEASA
jgi:hypothetical protein